MKMLRVMLLPVVLVALTFSTTIAASPDVPRLISYQGYLTDAGGGAVADGAHVVQFKIWNDPTLAAPANEKWWSGVIAVTTTNGLFHVQLGNPGMNPIDPDIFVDSNLWLGVTLGADPEIAPRTKLTTSPYAFSARLAQTATEAGHASTADNATTADALTAPLDHGALIGLGDDDHDRYVNNTGDNMTGNLDLYSAGIRYGTVTTTGGHQTYGSDGNLNARIHGNNWGQINLWDAQVSNVNTVEINAQSSSGGEMIVRNSAGSQTHRLDAGNTGNSAVIFPNDAISADETLEEPGVAANRYSSGTTITSTSAQTVISTSITVPGPGYVVASVTAYVVIIVSSSMGNVIVGLADAPVTIGSSDFVIAGAANVPMNTGTYTYPIVTEKIFAVGSSGSFTYYCNARRAYTDGSTTIYYPRMILKYYPTSYGSVVAVSEQSYADQFQSAELSTPDIDPSSGLTSYPPTYSVDLAELVARARSARAAAEKAELELRIALEKQQSPNSSTEASSEDR